MLSFLKKLFGGEAAQQQKLRRLSHPSDLREGDIIKFGYLPQPELSNTEFEVSKINTYIYGDLCYPELILKDRAGNLLYMMVEEEDGEESLGIAKKIPKSLVEELFDQAELDEVLKRGAKGQITLRKIPAEFKDWLVKSYKEADDNVAGAFVKGDARYLSDYELKQQEKFVSYVLIDATDEFALEIEVYTTNEMEICATLYHDIEAIEEMWPRSAEGEFRA